MISQMARKTDKESDAAAQAATEKGAAVVEEEGVNSIVASVSAAAMKLLRGLAFIVAALLFLFLATLWLICDLFLAKLSVSFLSAVSNLIIFAIYFSSPTENFTEFGYTRASSLADVPASIFVVTSLVWLSLRLFGRELELHKDQVFYDSENGGFDGSVLSTSPSWRRQLPFLLILLANLAFFVAKFSILELPSGQDVRMAETLIALEVLLSSALCLRAAKVWRDASAAAYIQAEVALLKHEAPTTALRVSLTTFLSFDRCTLSSHAHRTARY